ncbi:MAG: hypothetical protein IJM68_04530 [Synergistaceae bacterium]|nr:hypothetical protein [Synergistaceae bacterium]
MPANLLIFDADYVAELTARMNLACDLFAEAVSSLKSAGNHEKWKCKERARIIESFDELNLKLDRLDTGVNETTRILGGSVSRFAALENQYDSQANQLSDELTSNYGFSATVRTGGSVPSEGHSAGASGAGAGTGASGAVAGAGAAGASAGQVSNSASEEGQSGGNTGKGRMNRAGGAGGFRIQAGSNMFNQRKNENQNTTNPDTYSDGSGGGTGGASMNVNLPVTHIPDNPSAAARGTKDTKEIANAALSSVVGTMTEALSSENSSDLEGIASRLSETYNAGRSVFESSAAILANPSQPHTSERLAMAAGLVALAQDSGSVRGASASGSGNFSQNAVLISSALQGNNEASELRNLLTTMAGQDSTSGSVSSSGGDSRSFLDMIMEELKKIFFGDQEGGVSSSSYSENSIASSSPVMKFLDNFVMDEAV